MPQDKIPYSEFAAKIKAKYPDYANVDDETLVTKMLEKYPQYGESVDTTGLTVKKKDGGSYLSQDAQPSSVPSGSEVQSTENTNPSEDDLIGQSLKIGDLERKTIPLAGGGTGGGSIAFQQDPEAAKQAKQLRDQLSTKGVKDQDVNDLYNDFSDIPKRVLEQPNFKQTILTQRANNPQEYNRTISAYKWQSNLNDIVADKYHKGELSSDELAGAQKFFTDYTNLESQPQSASYEIKRRLNKQALDYIDQLVDNPEKKKKMQAAFATDRAFTYGTAPDDDLKNDSRKQFGLSDNQIRGLQYLDDTNPEQSKQYNSILIDPSKIQGNETAKLGYEEKAKHLEETGLWLKRIAIQEQLNKVAAKDPSEITDQDKQQFSDLTQQKNDLEKQSGDLNLKYPSVVKQDADEFIQDIIGQQLGGVSHVLGKTGQEVGNTASGVWDMISEPFRSGEGSKIHQLEALGQLNGENTVFHVNRDSQILQNYDLKITPDLHKLIDPIVNDDKLSWEDKYKQIYPILTDHQSDWGKIPKKASLNITPSSLYYSIGDMGASLAPFIGLEAMTGGGATAGLLRKAASTFTSALATSFHETYANDVKQGVDDPYLHALRTTAINAAAMTGAGTPQAIRKILGGASTAYGDVVGKLSDDEILSAINQSTIGKIKNAVGNGLAEGFKGGAKFEAVMAGAKVLNQKLDGGDIDPEQLGKEALVGILNFSVFGGIAGLAHVTPTTELQKDAVFKAGQEPQPFLEAAQEKLKNGQIDKDQYGNIVNNINLSSEIQKRVPFVDNDGKLLSTKDRSDLMLYKMQEAKINEASTGDIPEKLREKYQDNLTDIRYKMDELYKGDYKDRGNTVSVQMPDEVSKPDVVDNIPQAEMPETKDTKNGAKVVLPQANRKPDVTTIGEQEQPAAEETPSSISVTQSRKPDVVELKKAVDEPQVESDNAVETKQPVNAEQPIEPTPKTRQEQVNDLIDRTRKLNGLKKNDATRASELNEIRKAAADLGVTVKAGRLGVELKNSNGKEVQKVNTGRNSDVATGFTADDYHPQTREHFDAVTSNPDVLRGLEIVGTDGRALSDKQKESAIKAYKDGKPTYATKQVFDYIESAVAKGDIELSDKTTGQRIAVPVKDYFESVAKEHENPVKDTYHDLDELNTILGEDSFNHAIESDYNHVLNNNNETERTAGIGENPTTATAKETATPKSPDNKKSASEADKKIPGEEPKPEPTKPAAEPKPTTNPTGKSEPNEPSKVKKLSPLRAAAQKVREEGILPDWLKADLPEGTQKQGFGGKELNEAIAKALELVDDAIEGGKEAADAIKEGFAHLKDYLDKNTTKYDEQKWFDKFSGGIKEALSTGEKKPSSKEEPEFTRISKAGLKDQYGFVKTFPSKSDQDVANATMQRLKDRADSNSISIAQQAANEVAAMKGKQGQASEHDIMTAAYHLMNLDEAIRQADKDGNTAMSDLLSQQRDEALITLRQLGNNSGRNLRLFGTVYKKAAADSIETTRIKIQKALGVDQLPKTTAELKASNLSANDKKKVLPYVESIEKLTKDLKDINDKVKQTLTNISDKELQDYVKKEIKRVAEKKAALGGKDSKAKREKLADKIEKVADKIEKFWRSEGDVQKMGASVDVQKMVADALRYVAQKIREDKSLPDIIKEAVGKYSGKEISKDDLETRIRKELVDMGIGEDEMIDKKEVAINKIKDIAENEKATTITQDMASKNLIKDVVDSYIQSDTPYDKVIDETTKELQQYLPDVKKENVEDALLHRGDYKQETRKEVESKVKQKEQDVRRLAATENKLRALEAANDIHEITNDPTLSKEEKKKAIEARKSDYEKQIDGRVSELQKELDDLRQQQKLKADIATLKSGKDIPKKENSTSEKSDAVKKLMEEKRKLLSARELQKKMDDINEQIERTKNEKRIFISASKNQKEASDQLKAARKTLDESYNQAGIRPERGNKTEITIAKEAEDAIKEIKDSNLDDDVKKEHIAQIEQDRDRQLNGTRQGVLTNLKTRIDSHIADITKQINDATDSDVSNLKELKKDLSGLSDMLSPNGENLKDQIDKADQDLNAIIKTAKGTELEADLRDIQSEYHRDWQRTSDELQRQQLMDKAAADLKEYKRKLAAGQYTEIPTNPYDVQRDEALVRSNAETERAWKQLNSMKMKALSDKTVGDKVLDARRSFLIASFGAIEKVAGSGVTKPILDPLHRQVFGRLAGAITGIKPTATYRLRDVYRQMANEKSATDFMAKRNNAYVDAIVKYQKALEGGNEKSIKAAKKIMDNAEVDHASSLAYLFINAGSHIDIKQIMVNSATDFDAKLGKYAQSFAKERSGKIHEIGYWLESVNRTHGAMKSVSARIALIDGYIENIQYIQRTEGKVTPEARQVAWDMASKKEYEEGRFGEGTYVSKKIGEIKNSKNKIVGYSAKFLFPVAKISINITKQGIDRALPIELAYRTLGKDAIAGMKLNKADGIEFGNFASTYYNGIKRGFDSLSLQQKKYINTLLSRGMAGMAQYLTVGFLLSSGAIKYGGLYNPADPFKRKFGKVIGADGQPLGTGDWEFFGHKAPKLLNIIINHSPYMLPASLAANAYQQGVSFKAFQSGTNEVIQRMPFGGMFDLMQGLMGGDDYKLERTIANVVPSFKGTAEYFDQDEQGNPNKRTSDSKDFSGRAIDMWKANIPGLRNQLPLRGGAVNEQTMKDPIVKKFTDKGMQLPIVNLNAQTITDKRKGTETKISEFPQEKQKQYLDKYNEYYVQELKKINGMGSVYVNSIKNSKGEDVSSVSLEKPRNSGQEYKRTPIVNLSKEKLQKLSETAQEKATKRAKKIVFNIHE